MSLIHSSSYFRRFTPQQLFSGIRHVSLFSLLSFVLLACTPARSPQTTAPGAQSPHPSQPWEDGEAAGLKGKLEYYTSKMDGAKRPYAVCATSDSTELKPVLVNVSPGASTDAGPNEIHTAEEYAWYAKKGGKDMITLRATGRGPGSVYQNYGELDVLEAIADVVTKYPVDRDRISVT